MKAAYAMPRFLVKCSNVLMLFCSQASKSHGLPAFKVRTSLPKYSEMYTVGFDDMTNSNQLAAFTYSVGRYFSEVRRMQRCVTEGSEAPCIFTFPGVTLIAESPNKSFVHSMHRHHRFIGLVFHRLVTLLARRSKRT